MTPCPDWRQLAVRREDPAGEREWDRAVVHLDSCGECRHEALLADPTLVFRRMPEIELALAAESAEVESVRRVVAAMRASRRLERSRTLPERARAGVSSYRTWRRRAAAAVLTATALGLGSDRLVNHLAGVAGSSPMALSRANGARLAGVAAGFPGAYRRDRRDAGAVAAAALATEPMLSAMEGLNRPKARVYQLRGEHLSVVMIVDEKLDV